MSKPATETPAFDYHVSAEVPADLDATWRAWTQPAQYGAWFQAVPGSIELDVRPGGRWRVSLASTGDAPEVLRGRYLDVVPRQTLVVATELDHGESVMEISFEARGDRTRIAIRQACDTRDQRDGARAGAEIILGWCARYCDLRSSPSARS